MPKRVLMQCSTQVNRDAVKRKTVNGVEHIVVSSFTLPDDVVMNGGLYPAEEIAKSYASLERTLAPIEHPVDADGQYISASDPTAIHNFYAGAFNENVRRENGRVHIDKVINVQEALKSERGRRLLDRIEELETNADARPIHTSTGVLLEVEELDEPRANAAGKQYTWIGRNMVFDHDAILLSSVGAAQPHEGVGMAVNRDGSTVDVERFMLNVDAVGEQPDTELSHDELERLLFDALNTPPLSADYVARVYPSRVVYSLSDQFFAVPYALGNGTVTISGVPLPVKRDESFVPNSQPKGNAMKEHMIAKIVAAGIAVNADATDAEILAQYDALHTNQQDESDNTAAADNTADLAAVVANALKPLTDRLDGIEAKANASANAERDSLAEIVGNSDKYAGITVDAAKLLDVDTLKTMAANCQPSFGVPLLHGNDNTSSSATTFDMPE